MPSTLVSPRVSAAVLATVEASAAPVKTVAYVDHKSDQTMTVGSGAGEANKNYSSEFTVSSGTPLDLDVTALVDKVGTAIVFTEVQTIFITNGSTTTGQDMTIGAGTNPLFAADPNPIKSKGGVKLIHNPNPGITVSGSVKTLRITVAAGTNVAGHVTIQGR